ncbi:phenylacetate--CoA ligase family protein [Psychroflexus salis]|uniref:Phenylacetate-CoA ligase n=1 Tax=Psychroflexus salis TaxID=1526574 RepID=A0A917E518_9FLAO|nr:phenylacetate--CoA ligase family protein [Psychroflexus salis]GGE05116.1 hypothetical protein GCM10010831_03470 [Psychroflexus salis]
MNNITNYLPNFVFNFLISFYNFLSYRKRYSGVYNKFLVDFKSNAYKSRSGLLKIQHIRLNKFLIDALDNSVYYKKYTQKINLSEINLHDFKILNKETLRKNLNEIITLQKKNGIVSKTGGTTGKSLEVVFTKEDMQERFAMLDAFRMKQGYKLGKKTAWFSGKSIISKRDISKNRFWKTDYLYKVRYYSTFHISEKYLSYYLEDLIKYQPEFFVGFPSTILEIAKYGIKYNIKFPSNIVKAIFPTAETITTETRNIIETYFNTKMFDQYASSEGAPFIFECEKRNLHLELQSGVFEVLDDNDLPVYSGRLIVTSFTTHGTPLIRYDIGDRITLEDENKVCDCGNNNPMVKEILGRIDDFIYSPENGKINLGNISNTLKGTLGIKKFQVIQDSLDEIQILIEIDDNFTEKSKKVFIDNWIDRVGNKMVIEVSPVEKIKVENSGKFRIVKNNIKHLINGYA